MFAPVSSHWPSSQATSDTAVNGCATTSLPRRAGEETIKSYEGGVHIFTRSESKQVLDGRA